MSSSQTLIDFHPATQTGADVVAVSTSGPDELISDLIKTNLARSNYLSASLLNGFDSAVLHEFIGVSNLLDSLFFVQRNNLVS